MNDGSFDCGAADHGTPPRRDGVTFHELLTLCREAVSRKEAILLAVALVNERVFRFAQLCC
jgi:hypothetical protein